MLGSHIRRSSLGGDKIIMSRQTLFEEQVTEVLVTAREVSDIVAVDGYPPDTNSSCQSLDMKLSYLERLIVHMRELME